jgi:hypothetical protein
MTPMTHNEAWQEVHVMASALLAASMEMSEAVGVLNIGAELLAVRESLEALNHAALKSISEVH